LVAFRTTAIDAFFRIEGIFCMRRIAVAKRAAEDAGVTPT
jgi:hypothetical protein